MKRGKSDAVVESVGLFREGHHDILVYRAWSLRTADLVDLIECLRPEEQRALTRILPVALAAKAFEAWPASLVLEIISNLPDELIRPVLNAMSPRAAAALVDQSAARDRDRLLGMAARRDTIDQVLRYPAGSVGRDMHRSLIQVTGSDSVGFALESVRRQAVDQGNTAEVYVVDVARLLIGRLSFRDLTVAPRQALIREVMQPVLEVARLEQNTRDALLRIRRYSLEAVPVVDDQGRLVGWLGYLDGQTGPARSRWNNRWIASVLIAICALIVLAGLIAICALIVLAGLVALGAAALSLFHSTA